MIFGFAIFVIGYALFYWGVSHFPGQKRYSLWYLLGIGSVLPIPGMKAGQVIQPAPPVQWYTGGQ